MNTKIYKDEYDRHRRYFQEDQNMLVLIIDVELLKTNMDYLSVTMHNIKSHSSMSLMLDAISELKDIVDNNYVILRVKPPMYIGVMKDLGYEIIKRVE